MISYAPDTIADFDLGTVATYSCNKSYRLIADSEGDIRTCVDGGEGNGGVFDGTESFCECKLVPQSFYVPVDSLWCGLILRIYPYM